ncbi:DgyrCDS7583 [Dimorphilus gyrociliatus]|uniref:Protein YIF1 n=2 Tax=Dimorphilus gyrociliatus TaxID=2664684 RepID=A0A7I8VRF6_9ANNE|nr:DgyrCDS7583 [Dimorphilus gyrociliatus]
MQLSGQRQRKQVPNHGSFQDPNIMDTSAPPQMSNYGNMCNPYPTPPPQQQPQHYQQPSGNSFYNQDMSMIYPSQQQQSQQQVFPGQQFVSDPVVANVAMQYGSQLADQGKQYVHGQLEKYFVLGKLQYYFAVDTAYVLKKLGLLIFPFAHKDWLRKTSQNEKGEETKAPPRLDVNAPDLYIPTMAFVTYILLAGFALGTKNKFTPEDLGVTASTAVVWLSIEILLLLFITYLLHVSTRLSYLDLFSYCGYKYFGMLVVIIFGLLLDSTGYYGALLYTGTTLVFFLVRALKFDISGRERRSSLYVLFVIALSQPVFTWWLTRHLV